MSVVNNQLVINDLASQWNGSGIEKGDVILIHSNISRTLRRFKKQGVTLNASDVLESFRAIVGEEGTLLFPLFNYDMGQPFDIRNTASKMGILTETARRYLGAVRTGNPMYSFAVIGHRANEFRGLCNYSGYGADSPFTRLKELDGKIAVLDLEDQASMTFYHHVEEMEKVPYRYHKKYKTLFTNLEGTQTEKEFSLFVRDIDKNVATDVNNMGDYLWQKGLYKGDKPGVGSGLRVISARALYEATAHIISSEKALGMLYRISEDKIH